MNIQTVGSIPNIIERRIDDFNFLCSQIGRCFSRKDTRLRAERYLRGLLGQVERKNGWQIAEYLGDATPYATQHLLGRASWSADDVRDAILRYTQEHLLEFHEKGVLIIDETGFLKKGNHSAGVQRQYSGTAGRIENCQIGVFLALSCRRGRVLLDRELYLPKSWCEDTVRCRSVGITEQSEFLTKPRLAQVMLSRAFSSGISPEWVLADSVYGSDSKFRRFLEERDQAYVLAVSSQRRLWVSLQQVRLDVLIRDVPVEDWVRLSAGDGSKGPRLYDWLSVAFSHPGQGRLQKSALLRRSVTNPEEYAYYLCFAPPETSVEDFAKAAGQRWAIESCFEAAKQETGLDEYEVRSLQGWYRHITLSMLALAFLCVIRSKMSPELPEEKGGSILSH